MIDVQLQIAIDDAIFDFSARQQRRFKLMIGTQNPKRRRRRHQLRVRRRFEILFCLFRIDDLARIEIDDLHPNRRLPHGLGFHRRLNRLGKLLFRIFRQRRKPW